MEGFWLQWLGILGDIDKPDGLGYLLVMLFPAFLLLEVPLSLVILLGVLRWFVRKPFELPEGNSYQPRVSCVITCYSEGEDVRKTPASRTLTCCSACASRPIAARSR